MKSIRRILLKALGIEGYLRIVSRIYIWLIDSGFLKSKYPELFFLKVLVKQGYTCLDIGANLGYYSTFMSKYAGASGKVYAVEPIPLFANIWKDNTKLSFKKNLTLFPYALGNENKMVTMSIPFVDGVLHHGMTKVNDTPNTLNETAQTFEVEMKNADELFSVIQKLDFVKIDIEGYEQYVIPAMEQTIRKFTPVIQAELGGEENRKSVVNFLKTCGYTAHVLSNNELILATETHFENHQSDFYFTHKNNII